MKEENRFKETRIRMVMKLKKLTRREAVEEIARMDAEKCETACECETEKGRGEPRRRRRWSANISCGNVMSAEEFFGG